MEIFKAEVYRKSISKASVNVKAEGRKEAKEIALKFVKDLEYTKQPDYEYRIVINGGK